MLPGIQGTACHWGQHSPLVGSTFGEAQVLQHAADAGEGAAPHPDLGQRIIQPFQSAVPVTRDPTVSAYLLDRLDDPLQDGNRHVIRDVLTHE